MSREYDLSFDCTTCDGSDRRAEARIQEADTGNPFTIRSLDDLLLSALISSVNDRFTSSARDE